MNGLTTGAAKTTKVDGRGHWARNARDPRAAGEDHLRRLCASLAEARRLLPSSGGGTVDEEAIPSGRARRLDALAFAMAVEAVLFLDALGELTPISRGTSGLLGRTMEAIDCLLHSLERSPKRASGACADERRTSDAMGSLAKTARHVRTKLADLRGLRIVTEFQSPGTGDARCANHAGLQGGEGQN